jgi:DNA-binding CsgD family transcriptional regulator
MHMNNIYRKVERSNRSHLEAHAGFFRLLMKGIFDPYVL